MSPGWMGKVSRKPPAPGNTTGTEGTTGSSTASRVPSSSRREAFTKGWTSTSCALASYLSTRPGRAVCSVWRRDSMPCRTTSARLGVRVRFIRAPPRCR